MFGAQGDATEFCNMVFDQYDTDHSGVINFQEFIMTLSVASRGTIDEKLLWAFDLYDRDNNGYLTEKEIVHVLTVSDVIIIFYDSFHGNQHKQLHFKTHKTPSQAVYKAKCKPNPYDSAAEVARNIVKSSDDNKDGKVSEAEFIHHAKNSKEIKELLQTL